MDSNETIKEERHGDRHDHAHCERRCRAWKFIPIFLVVIALKGVLTMLLWNALIPDLFHGPVLNFPQAVGLIVLAKLVVGFHHHGFGRFGGHGYGHHHHRGRWSRLSREERAKIREHLRG